MRLRMRQWPSMESRESRAFEILVREHADMLIAYLRAMAWNDALVDDAFQEAIIVAWRRLPDFDRSKPFAPWLRGIARNTLLGLARKQQRRHEIAGDAAALHLEHQLARIESTPADRFSDRLEPLMDCMKRLAPEQREAVELVYGQSLDNSVAASTAGTNDETFRKRLYRARMQLAECLRRKGILEGEPA
ncbi:MAG: sigma-70 family RNA polymerase sigma factor [Phycisphaerae bacterium]|nr:sigma-70 family RNA polymerase sigma factor [Phycisphaerae bacterium]